MFFEDLGTGSTILLVICLLVACGFEFVNGFHDTANAVATVIYTKSLQPWIAVIWSGFCNFLGVFAGGIGVAMGIIGLLPIDLLVSKGTGAGLAMVLALLLAAIIWNLGTWYLGLPASSSHTLIGAILGVGMANSLLPGHTLGSGVNWGKATEIGLSLLVSPLVGFSVAALLLLLCRLLIKNEKLYSAPKGDEPPPWWIRTALVVTCTGVSFAHGSNDGQKGVGLIMLILIGIVPAQFALNMSLPADHMAKNIAAARQLETTFQKLPPNTVPPVVFEELKDIQNTLTGKASLAEIPKDNRWRLRSDILLIDDAVKKLQKGKKLNLSEADAKQLKSAQSQLHSLTEYAPSWVLIAVALSLGIGTMIGWERIVITVGAKIGKEHLTYAQGASAELVAMSAIGFASVSGLPVSTTHVLSSGIAGTMVAQKSGLQAATVKKIASAWVLTLPASMLLAGALFMLLRFFIA
ncbi:MAG: inorganic phosphate transporter [Blastocatellia bacterium]|nr:inorganic phosphate transporter [Blastocatellia bacterium]